MRNKSIIFLTLIILFLSACGTKYEVDNSTAEDWRTNVALWHSYRNKLIFTAIETTSPEGEKEMKLVASNRNVLVSIFQRLELDGVPSMNESRKNILRIIQQSPGGEKVNMSGNLSSSISNFWDKVLKYAEKHGVSPER